jgi:hypothetical protein
MERGLDDGSLHSWEPTPQPPRRLIQRRLHHQIPTPKRLSLIGRIHPTPSGDDPPYPGDVEPPGRVEKELVGTGVGQSGRLSRPIQRHLTLPEPLLQLRLLIQHPRGRNQISGPLRGHVEPRRRPLLKAPTPIHRRHLGRIQGPQQHQLIGPAPGDDGFPVGECRLEGVDRGGGGFEHVFDRISSL